MKRKFYQTTCPECGGVDGSVISGKDYDPSGDLAMWRNEEREYKEVWMEKGEKINWCTCEMEDEE